ncbi:hypothetical protein CAEBREN_12756 [Caenorhabditis brenneri]|uniref:Uncharacterized protein n=1 Tax=Caenorhabditis brenneri TaxID=135651 RepID=G0MBR2_CAEBE|nr:hypothetical protein CAEBREN_12756 [Caenorhabditis brenneri]
MSMQTEPYEDIEDVPRLGWTNNIRTSVIGMYFLLFSSAIEIIFSKLEPYSPAQMFLWKVSNISFILYIITFYFDCRREYLLAKLSVEEREAEERKQNMSRFFKGELPGPVETMAFAESRNHRMNAYICIASHFGPTLEHPSLQNTVLLFSFIGLCIHSILILMEIGTSVITWMIVQEEREMEKRDC